MSLIRSLIFASSLFLSPVFAETATGDVDPLTRLHIDWMDKTVSPRTDFYSYANGNWQKNNLIPPEYAVWGIFSILEQRNQDIIHQMLMTAAADKTAKTGSLAQKVGDFFYSGMDESSIEALGISPLQSEFDKINAIKTREELQDVITRLQLMGVDTMFDFGSMQDFKNSSEMIGVAMQSGLGLPDRDYYLKNDEKFRQIRKAYVHHMAKMFELLGDTPATAARAADRVMTLETRLAQFSMSQIEQRSPQAVYNMKTLRELRQLTPDFSWPRYFSALGLPGLKRVNIGMPEYFKKMNDELRTVSLQDWKIYLRWHLVDTYAPFLSKPFVDENFKMVSALTGVQKLLPRWKRVVNTENAALGFAIGKLYVEKYFPPKAKQAVRDILNNIRQALRDDLETLSWMTPATRKAALKKLALMQDRVGYPDKWRDYSKLLIDRGPYVLNVLRTNQFLTRRSLDKIGKPVDRSEWGMTPQTINAYYDPSMNNINIPAGILQPPFFDPKGSVASNYGAIGFIIGHEMTHGFDDQGAQFDGDGNLKNWWTAEDLKKFKQATDCIVNQFSKYQAPGSLPVQGKLVVGEATADLGGLTLALRAFHASKAGKNAKTLNGLTPDQQFFLAAAHVWAANIRTEQARNLITTDPHPPMQYRVNGSLANMPQFYEAFGIQKPSPMINSERCAIW